MNLATTILFYLLLGAATAAALVLRVERVTGRERVFRATTALLFWPLYLPALLQAPAAGAMSDAERKAGAQAPAACDDGLTRAIGQVEAELDLALASLDGWSDAVLAREQDRFAELRAAWRLQAARIGELDCLLDQPAFRETGILLPGTPHVPSVTASESVRRENIQRLQAVRQRLHEDLISTLAKVRELVTMIHLARYTGAPASRAEELVTEIAAAVAGLSEVAEWQETVFQKAV